MARTKKTPFPAWQTKKNDGIEQRYTRLGNSQLLSEAAYALNHAAFRVYVYMLLESGGKRDFEFPYSKYKNYLSKDGFKKVTDELCKKGFIEVLQRNKNRRISNVYRFSEGWKKYSADCSADKER